MRRWLGWLVLLHSLALAAPALAGPAEQAAIAEAAALIGAQPQSGRGVMRGVDGKPGYVEAVHAQSGTSLIARYQVVSLAGPTEGAPEEWQRREGEPIPAPWGGQVKERWIAYRSNEGVEAVADVDASGQAVMVQAPPMPAEINWTWTYPQHLATVAVSYSWDDGEVARSRARADVQRIAEALHRGAVAHGLTEGAVSAGGAYRVLIHLPAIRPGDTLSPSVDVLDAQGRPAVDVRGIALLINGQFANSVVWDGQRTVIEAQVSVAGKALVEQRVLPAWGTPPPVDEAGPVPGLGAVGPLPPPRSLKETLVGVFAPPLLGLLAALANGLRGTHAPRGPPPSKPKPKAKPKQPKSRKPSVPADDPARARAERTLNHLAEVARRTGDKGLANAVSNARAAIGKEGKLDPAAWTEAQQGLREALGKLPQGIPAPTWATADAARAGGAALKEFGVGVGKGLYGLGAGIFNFGANAWTGLKGIAHGLMNPRDFERGIREILKNFGREHLAAENKAFGEGLREGRYGDALKALAQGMLKTASHTIGGAWDWAKREVLPWDELKSFFDSHASFEERLWAVPAAAVKMASILTMFTKPTTMPSTRWGTALENVRDRLTTSGLAKVSAEATSKVGRLEQQLGALRQAGGKAPNATVQQMIARTEKALEQARIAQQAAQKVHEVELLARQAMRGREALGNLQQAQRALNENPALAQAIDDALRTHPGVRALDDLRARGLISQDTHALMTARRFQTRQRAVPAKSPAARAPAPGPGSQTPGSAPASPAARETGAQPPSPAPPAPAGASATTRAAKTSARPPAKKRLFQGNADGSEIEIVPPSEVTPSNHSSLVGDISLESINRAKHYRFFKVDRAGIRMLEPGAGVEDLCDVMLPKNKRPWEITATDIIVCTSDKAEAVRIRAQVMRHLEQITRG